MMHYTGRQQTAIYPPAHGHGQGVDAWRVGVIIMYWVIICSTWSNCIDWQLDLPLNGERVLFVLCVLNVNGPPPRSFATASFDGILRAKSIICWANNQAPQKRDKLKVNATYISIECGCGGVFQQHKVSDVVKELVKLGVTRVRRSVTELWFACSSSSSRSHE